MRKGRAYRHRSGNNLVAETVVPVGHLAPSSSSSSSWCSCRGLTISSNEKNGTARAAKASAPRPDAAATKISLGSSIMWKRSELGKQWIYHWRRGWSFIAIAEANTATGVFQQSKAGAHSNNSLCISSWVTVHWTLYNTAGLALCRLYTKTLYLQRPVNQRLGPSKKRVDGVPLSVGNEIVDQRHAMDAGILPAPVSRVLCWALKKEAPTKVATF